MKKLISLIYLLTALCSSAAILEWDRNAETYVAGYIVYTGTGTRQYDHAVNVGQSTNWLIEGLTVGAKYYFAVTAYTVDGLESDFSEEISWTVTEPPVRPLPPVRARIAGTNAVSLVVEATRDVIGQWVPIATLPIPADQPQQYFRIQTQP